jgi:hypothetical protein
MLWNWIKRVFSAPTEAKEVLYCKKDGAKLVVTKTVLEYSPYTGLPSAWKVVKTCPVCNTEYSSDTGTDITHG